MREGQAIDWDSPIVNDGENKEFFLFPDGAEVNFEVMELQRSSSKNLHCPMAKLVLRLFDKDGEHEAQCYENLVLHTSCEWKLCEFFRSIGQRQHGEKIVPDWSKVEGSRGLCVVSVNTYEKNGETRKNNRVKNYIDADDVIPESIPSDPEF